MTSAHKRIQARVAMQLFKAIGLTRLQNKLIHNVDIVEPMTLRQYTDGIFGPSKPTSYLDDRNFRDALSDLKASGIITIMDITMDWFHRERYNDALEEMRKILPYRDRAIANVIRLSDPFELYMKREKTENPALLVYDLVLTGEKVVRIGRDHKTIRNSIIPKA